MSICLAAFITALYTTGAIDYSLGAAAVAAGVQIAWHFAVVLWAKLTLSDEQYRYFVSELQKED